MNDGLIRSKVGNEWMLGSNVKKDLKVLKRMEVHSTAGGKKNLREKNLAGYISFLISSIEDQNDGSSRQKTTETTMCPVLDDEGARMA